MQTEVLDALLTLRWCLTQQSMSNEVTEAISETIIALPDDVKASMVDRRLELERGRQGDGT